MIFQAHILASSTDSRIALFEDRDKGFDKVLSLLMDPAAQSLQLLVINLQIVQIEGVVGSEELELGISLGEHPIVIQKVLQIWFITLGDHSVYELSSNVTSLCDQIPIRR